VAPEFARAFCPLDPATLRRPVRRHARPPRPPDPETLGLPAHGDDRPWRHACLPQTASLGVLAANLHRVDAGERATVAGVDVRGVTPTHGAT
jgi:hypothetical protein